MEAEKALHTHTHTYPTYDDDIRAKELIILA